MAAAAGARGARVEAKGGGDEDEDEGEAAHTPVASSFPPSLINVLLLVDLGPHDS